MIVNIILIACLILGILKGWRRGFVLQIFHIFSFLASIIIARFLYEDFASIIRKIIPYPNIAEEKWSGVLAVIPLENTYYNVISFVLIMLLTRIILGFIARGLNVVTRLPVIHTTNRVIGAVLGFVERYIILFFIVLILALIPATEAWIYKSSLALFILHRTPYLSNIIEALGIA